MPLLGYAAAGPFVVGGMDASTGTPVADIFEVTAGGLEHVCSLPVKVYGASAALWAGKLFVAGGRVNGAENRRLLVFTLHAPRGAEARDLPGGLSGDARIAAFRGRLYVVGGSTGRARQELGQTPRCLQLRVVHADTLQLVRTQRFTYHRHFDLVQDQERLLLILSDRKLHCKD